MKATKYFAAAALLIFSSNSFASLENDIGASPLVRSLVLSIAGQSYGSEGVECNFETVRLVSLGSDLNNATFQAQITCPSGINEQMQQVYLKGYVEDSQIWVTGIQLGRRLR